ncbi:hypothetical protein A20C1_03513 [marine actinobacterium PHSC20C1]|nr:hypothetical protein A20C1_03513 [marine actinobacterium PHSC20C1]
MINLASLSAQYALISLKENLHLEQDHRYNSDDPNSARTDVRGRGIRGLTITINTQTIIK